MQAEAKLASADDLIQQMKAKKKKKKKKTKKKAGDENIATKVPCDPDATRRCEAELESSRVRSHTLAHTDTYNQCHLFPCTCDHTLAWRPTQAHTSKYHTQTYPHMRTLTRTCTYTRTPPHAHANAHAYAHACAHIQ